MKEQRKNAAQTAGLQVVKAEVEKGDTGLIACTLARTEVFAKGATDEQRQTYQAFFRRENAQEIAVSGAIADKAAEIRRKTAEVDSNGKIVRMMKTPDAIHLAVAIIYGAEFQTWDGSGDPPRDFSLLQFNGSDKVDRLKITEPKADMGPLFSEATSATKLALPSSSGPAQPA